MRRLHLRLPFSEEHKSFVFLVLLYLPLSSFLSPIAPIAGIVWGAVLAVWVILRSGMSDGDTREQEIEGRTRVCHMASAIILVFMAIDLFRLPTPHGIQQTVHLLVAAGVVSACFFFELRFEGMLGRHPILLAALAILISAAITLFLFTCNLQAQWGITDDHEIMAKLDADGTFPLWKIPSALLGTEVGAWTSVRFRPSYYSLRLLEISLWGMSPSYWYIARMAMAIFCTTLLMLCLTRWLGFTASVLIILYAHTLAFWSDIWCRLGPPETYAAVGTALFVWGAFRIWYYPTGLGSNPRSMAIDLFAIGTGAVLAMGSKENFVLLVPAAWVVGWIAIRRGAHRWPVLLCLSLITLYGAFISARVAFALSYAGADVYGRSTHFSDRVLMLWNYIRGWSGPRQLLGVVSAGIGVASLVTVLRWRHQAESLTVVARWGVTSAILIILVLSQIVFYAGRWPTGGRYDFPGILAVILLVVVSAHWALKLFVSLGLEHYLCTAIRLGLLVGLSLLVCTKGFDSVVIPCCENATRTKIFSSRIMRAVGQLRKKPHNPVLIVCGGPSVPFEAAHSLPRFLRAHGIQNQIFLQLVDLTASNAFLKSLLEGLNRISKDGNNDYQPFRRFFPLRDHFVMRIRYDGPIRQNGVDLGRFH